LQLADCRENLRVREAKFELHEQCRNLFYIVYRSQQIGADPEAGLHRTKIPYVAIHQALQHSERSQTLLGRRVGEQLEDDRLSEDKRKVEITAFFMDQEELACQVVSLKHSLAEMEEALKTERSTNIVRDRRIMVLESIFICLKQEQHSTRLAKSAAHEAKS